MPEKLKAGNAAALLVDRDDRHDLAEFAEAVGEGTELGGALDVASEEDEAARLDPADEVGVGLVDFVAGDA